ncbi:unnamed protein product [Cylicostephanus goldi]|uniref:Uncharacterized protein n=1 Tax=Cylicostephanus goldi TaxID=71465 RepID=A0A3P6R3X5_CYLGO|nr:unnamed protein product [Cylicostephanus goldi]
MANFKVTAVAIEDDLFEIPASYRTIDDLNASLWWPEDEQDMSNLHGGASPMYHPSMQQQEEMLLQLAIQESFRTGENAGSGASLGPLVPDALPAYDEEAEEERQLAMAIQESLRTSGLPPAAADAAPEEAEDSLALALRLSRDEEQRRREEAQKEEEELQRILQLSLVDK